jgi:hypothetical protein
MSYLAKKASWPKIAILNLSPSVSTWSSQTPTFTPSLKTSTTNLPYTSIVGNTVNLSHGCYYVEFWVGGSKSSQATTGYYSTSVNGIVTSSFIGYLNGENTSNRAEGCFTSFTINDNSGTLTFGCTTVASSGTFTFTASQCFAILYKI